MLARLHKQEIMGMFLLGHHAGYQPAELGLELLLRITRVHCGKLQELDRLSALLDKLQETVNKTNWDEASASCGSVQSFEPMLNVTDFAQDMVDTFQCLYAMRATLQGCLVHACSRTQMLKASQGERARQLYLTIWRNKDFRSNVCAPRCGWRWLSSLRAPPEPEPEPEPESPPPPRKKKKVPEPNPNPNPNPEPRTPNPQPPTPEPRTRTRTRTRTPPPVSERAWALPDRSRSCNMHA